MRHAIEHILDSAPSIATATLFVGGWLGVLGMLLLSFSMRWRSHMALHAA